MPHSHGHFVHSFTHLIFHSTIFTKHQHWDIRYWGSNQMKKILVPVPLKLTFCWRRLTFKNHTNKCIINKKSQCYRTTYSVTFYLFLGSSFSNESLKPCTSLKYLTTLHIQFLSRLWFYFLLISLAFLSEFKLLIRILSTCKTLF